MPLFAKLTAAFKSGAAAQRVPISAGHAPPWAMPLGTAATETYEYRHALTQAFERNAVAQRAVRIVTEGVASAPLLIEEPQIARLLGKGDSGGALLEMLGAHLLLHGNAYARIARDGSHRPVALYPLRPERVEIVPGDDGWPVALRYRAGAHAELLPLEDADGWPAIIHWRALHPADDHYGGGCLTAAAEAVAIHNAASRWNRTLLENAARPSGALVYRADGSDGTGTLTREQHQRLSDELTSAFSGAANAGRPMLLEGGLTWQSLSLSPADMDFATLKAAAARDIALAFGVPPMLLGLPGDNTYSNYREANRALWRLTLLPLLDKLLCGLANGLAPWFPHASIRVDLDRIAALSEDRERLWSQVTGADFLSEAEKRAMLGLAPRDENHTGTKEDA